MEYVLDDQRLNGAIPITTAARPARYARTVRSTDIANFRRAIELNCQMWAGAASPIIPVGDDARIDPLYVAGLRSQDIDRIIGMEYGALESGDFRAAAEEPGVHFDAIFAPSILRNKEKEYYLPLSVAMLEEDDPWRDIYAVCLGVLPATPDLELLKQSHLLPTVQFDTFINVERNAVSGSLQDLIARINDYSSITPRRVTMNKLAHGYQHSTSIRVRNNVLPNPMFDAVDAGPNIVVVCSPGNVDDLSLLWNLRAAHGDSRVLPIGIPRASISVDSFQSLFNPECMSLNGLGETSVYVTSTSMSIEEIESVIPGRSFRATDPSALVTLGPAPSRTTKQIAVWHEGEASIVPFSSVDESELLNALPPNYAEWKVDVSVDSQKFPNSRSLRVDSFNQQFFAGKTTHSISPRKKESVTIAWPSRLLSLKTIAAAGNFKVKSSEPGKAALTLLESLDDVWELDMFAHRPLVELLQAMSERQGINWAKKRATRNGETYVTSREDVAPTSDDLIEQPFEKFKAALNNDTKATTSWLNWAEDRRLIIKGFPISCPSCEAKQWIPVSAFTPPISCRGCDRNIRRPFPQGQVKFKYRLGESLRRVFAQDALGHLLALRFFVRLMGDMSKNLIGLHPGLEAIRENETQIAGEADVLMMLSNGDCIPAEVKKSFVGVTEGELVKLENLRAIWNAPWSVVAVTDYAHNAPDEFADIEQRGEEIENYRILLTYDQMLEPHPIWALGSDPFEWKPMSIEAISDREKEFAAQLHGRLDFDEAISLESSMLYKRAIKDPAEDAGEAANGNA